MRYKLRERGISSHLVVLASILLFGTPIFVPLGSAQAKFRVLYSFNGENDGDGPKATLIRDEAGNLYGTTTAGGVYNGGTVFKLALDGTETVLHSFAGGSDGNDPEAGLIADDEGNLYGTTFEGGGGAGCYYGCGTVFRVAPDGTETVLYAFTGGNDGTYPTAGLIADKAGNLYGTTSVGGAHYNGTVFELAPNGTLTVFHDFLGKSKQHGDGANPRADLVADVSGNFYGTTEYGGANDEGTIFQLAPDGTETVLYSFGGSIVEPIEPLVADSAGNLYTTTFYGGDYYNGTVFRLAPDGTGSVLYSFMGGRDGAYPLCGLIWDLAGNLYGTTNSGNGKKWSGTIFKLAPDGTETVLHSFKGDQRGSAPYAGLFADKKGHLYGTTASGGTDGQGTVFSLKE